MVMDKQEIPVSAGNRHVALVGPGGTKCDEQVALEAGKTTTLKCEIASAVGSAGSAAGSGAGSAVPALAGSGAGSAATPATGSASSKPATAETVKPATETVKPATETVKPATTEVKPTTVKPSTAKVDTTGTFAAVPTHPTTPAPTHPTPAPTHPTTPAPTHPPAVTSKPETPRVEVPKPPVDTAGKGYLTITSKPNAKIAVDGVDTGLTTPIGGHALSLAPGKHKITFVMGDDRYTFPVVITAGQTQAMSKDLE